MWPISPALAGALRAGERVTDHRVDVLDESGRVIGALGDSLLGGEVTCDGLAGVRWSGHIVVTGDLVPRRVGDLLHPLSYNRVRPWVRVRVDGGGWEEIPLAPMYVTGLGDLSDSGLGSGVTATLPVADAVALIRRSGWRSAIKLGGKSHGEAIRQIVGQVAPWLTVEVVPTGSTLPAEYEVGEPGRDPWADVETLCEAASLRAYINREGALTVEPRATGPRLPVWEFAAGDWTMTDLTASVDLSTIDNVVAVQSDSEDVDPPVVGWWEDADETSPTSTARGHIRFSGIVKNPAVTTKAQAEQAAALLGASMRSAIQSAVIEAAPLPHLDPDDVVAVVRESVGVSGVREVDGWTIQLDPSALMAVSVVGRVDV